MTAPNINLSPNGNGVHRSELRNGALPTGMPDRDAFIGKPKIALNAEQFRHFMQSHELSVQNAALTSRQFLQDVLDPRRDIDSECGYPISGTQISLDAYRDLYDREAIANRVVQVMPKECWQQSPTVYEDDDPDKVTPFEEAWDSLEISSGGSKSWHQDEVGGTVWEYLFRADMLSGIGHFGVILMGYDDGKNLAEPLEGVVTVNWKRVPVWNTEKVMAMNADGRFLPTLRRKQVGVRMVKSDKPLRPIPPDSPWRPEERTALDAMLKNNTLTIKSGQGKAETEQLFTLNHLNAAELLTQTENATKPTSPDKRPRRADQPDVRPLGRQVPDPSTAEPSRGNLGGSKPGGSKSQDAFGGGQFGDSFGKQYDSGYGDQMSSLGTDQQYLGVQFGPGESLSDQPAKEGRKLLFMRPYDESLVQIVRYEWNVRSPRFGLPTMYRITLNDPREQHSGIGLPLATVFVHWSRVVHLADNLGNSEIFGVPRMRPVLNRLLDLRKIYGADGEAFWKNALLRLFLKTVPQLGGDVDVDLPAIKDMMEKMENSSQRYGVLTGMEAQTIAPSVVDPTAHVAVHLEAICIALGIPIRVFKGSERGELASSQDDAAWNDRLRHRQHNYLTPRVICPLVDRLIAVGVLPEPEGYTVEWPDLDSTTDSDKATIGGVRTTALAAYVSGNCESMVPPQEFLIHFLGFTDEEAEAIIDAAKEGQDDPMTMPPAGDPGHPASEAPPPPPPPNTQVGPGMSLAHPETGKILSTAPGKPPAPIVAPAAAPPPGGPPKGGAPMPTGKPPAAPTGKPPQPKAPTGKPPSPNRNVENGWADLPALRSQMSGSLDELTANTCGNFQAAGDVLGSEVMPGYGQIWFHEASGTAWYVGGDSDEPEFEDKVKDVLMELPNVEEVTYASEYAPRNKPGWKQVYDPRKSRALPISNDEADECERQGKPRGTTALGYGCGDNPRISNRLEELLTNSGEGSEGRFITLKNGNVVHIGEGQSVGEAIKEHFDRVSKAAGHKIGGEHESHDTKHGHDDHAAHSLEHTAHDLHHAHETAEGIHETLSDLLGDKKSSGAAIDAAEAGAKAAHGAIAGAHETAEHAGGALHGAANIGGLVAAKLYPHAMKAVTSLLSRAGPKGEAAAKAITALHEGASKIAEKATQKLQERYGKATTAAILGAGAVASTSALHAVGVPGPATKLVPFKGLLGSIPFIAAAEVGRQMGIIHKDSHVEKKLMVAATWVHGIRGAVESRAGKVGSAIRDKVTGRKKVENAMIINKPHPDDDEVTLSPEELKAAAKEFHDTIAKEYADLLKEHLPAIQALDQTPKDHASVSNRLRELLANIEDEE